MVMRKRAESFYYKNIVVQIFRNHWERFKEYHSELVNEDIEENVEKMLGCGLKENGYFEYRCLKDGEEKIIPFTCKSRFCLRCSRVYIDRWVNKMKEIIFKGVNHRHVILTIPGSLWEYFRNGALMKELSDSGVKTIEEVMIISNKGKEIEPGIIEVTQTAGRASTWNPHLHFMVTEGGLDKNGKWQEITYFDYETLRKKWMYNLLKMMETEFIDNLEVKSKINEIYIQRGDKGLIARAKREKIRKRDIVSYLISYVASPPIALSRITGYDGKEVCYWYREHPTDREVEVRVSAYEFIRRMIQHIMPRQLKMVRHYGLYARNKVGKVREILDKIFDGVRKGAEEIRKLVMSPKNYRERMIKSFGRDPLKCPRCGGEMELWKIWHPRHGDIYDFVRDSPEIIEEIEKDCVVEEEEIRERQYVFSRDYQICLSSV